MIIAKHTGGVPQLIALKNGNSHTLLPETEVELDVDDMSPELIDHYAERGVKILTVKKKAATKAADTKLADDIKKAEAAVDAAKKAVEAADTDDELAQAGADLQIAEDALSALKA